MATAKRFAKWSLLPVDRDVRSSMHVYFNFPFSLLVATIQPCRCTPVNCVFPAHRPDLNVFTSMNAIDEASHISVLSICPVQGLQLQMAVIYLSSSDS